MDIAAEEEVIVGFARARVVGVEIDMFACGEGGCGFEAARVDGFEREVCGLEDGGLRDGQWLLQRERIWWKERRTRCSSRTKMPLPIMATPIDMLIYVSVLYLRGEILDFVGASYSTCPSIFYIIDVVPSSVAWPDKSADTCFRVATYFNRTVRWYRMRRNHE